jgi:peptidoglycan/xylan/chitin deacetylase (PgdA/CDA1 family)
LGQLTHPLAKFRKQVLLSFDVEEFDLPCEYNHPIRLAEQLDVGAEGFRRVLDLLDETGARATMFCTGVFAENHPELIARAAKRHEIASHGWSHSSFVPGDLAKSRQMLEQLSGQPCVGYRMARMSKLDPGLVAQAGYRYNSSENPIWLPGRYNNLFKPRRPYMVLTPHGECLQIPASATPFVRWPLFWLAFKNMPLISTKLATAACLAADDAAVLYFHPWEFADLSRYPLPSAVARVDGTRLLGKLRAYITWLGRVGKFATYSEFTHFFSAKKTPAATGS